MEQSRLACSRGIVLDDYNSATKRNQESFITGDVKASSEYIYPNQKEDAYTIVNTFYTKPIRVISVVKKTKVGMDGLMIELAVRMTTHPDDSFVLHRQQVFFITGMSNKSWEDDMKDKIPTCFKENVHHHGQLQRLQLANIKNALIIIDEIDSGDKEYQKLHLILKESCILNLKYMDENNIRFVFVSATMINELRELFKWGDKHYTHYMTIPDMYIGHEEFLELDIIQEYYTINDNESAEKWVQEDILQNYGLDYRVHLIRSNKKNIDFIMDACIRNNIDFKNHNTDDRISSEELSDIFNNISNHLVIAVKGFYRRANLIPNEWKMKIGATHEQYVKKYDTNVQVQGFPGRMSGYWKDAILQGHKTGPHRTSINAIKEYKEFYKNPFGNIKYSTINSKPFVHPNHIEHLDPIREVSNTNKRIPVVIDGLNATDVIFTTSKRKLKLEFVRCLLNKSHVKLFNFITHPSVVCSQISQPNSKQSYKKHITDVVNASIKKNPYIVDNKEKYKDINNWQLFIDNKENRLCFVIWCINQDLYV
jgi:hypothetical protein